MLSSCNVDEISRQRQDCRMTTNSREVGSLSKLIGRERELSYLRDALRRTRALTLCGAGGIGKKLPRRAAGKRDVEPIVDDDARLVAMRELDEGGGRRQEPVTRHRLGAELEKAGAAAQVCRSEIEDRPARMRRDVGVDNCAQGRQKGPCPFFGGVHEKGVRPLFTRLQQGDHSLGSGGRGSAP